MTCRGHVCYFKAERVIRNSIKTKSNVPEIKYGIFLKQVLVQTNKKVSDLNNMQVFVSNDSLAK